MPEDAAADDEFVDLFLRMLRRGEIDVDLDLLSDDRARRARAFSIWKAEQDPYSPAAQAWRQRASHLRGLAGDHRLIREVEAAMAEEFGTNESL